MEGVYQKAIITIPDIEALNTTFGIRFGSLG